jgi:hypothetical protein
MALSAVAQAPVLPTIHSWPRSQDHFQEINLFLSVQKPSTAGYEHETLQVFPGNTVRDVKLRLRNKSWFRQGAYTLVFGDRELLEEETVGEVVRQQSIAGENSGNFLHIFVRLCDVEVVQISTATRELSFTNDEDLPASPKSSLTSALQAMVLHQSRYDWIMFLNLVFIQNKV